MSRLTRPLTRRLRQHRKANAVLAARGVLTLVAHSVLGAFLRFEEALCVFLSWWEGSFCLRARSVSWFDSEPTRDVIDRKKPRARTR